MDIKILGSTAEKTGTILLLKVDLEVLKKLRISKNSPIRSLMPRGTSNDLGHPIIYEPEHFRGVKRDGKLESPHLITLYSTYPLGNRYVVANVCLIYSYKPNKTSYVN